MSCQVVTNSVRFSPVIIWEKSSSTRGVLGVYTPLYMLTIKHMKARKKTPDNKTGLINNYNSVTAAAAAPFSRMEMS